MGRKRTLTEQPHKLTVNVDTGLLKRLHGHRRKIDSNLSVAVRELLEAGLEVKRREQEKRSSN